METIKLEDNMQLELNGGRFMTFKYMSDFDNPVFLLDGDKNKMTIVDNTVYSISGDDEPSCPVIFEYQAAILETHDYNFFKETFEIKRGA